MVLLCVVAEYRLQGALQPSPVTSLEGGSGGPRTPREGAKKPKLCFPESEGAWGRLPSFSVSASPCTHTQGAGGFRLIPDSSLLGASLDQVGKQVFQVGWGSRERWTLSLSLSFHALTTVRGAGPRGP